MSAIKYIYLITCFCLAIGLSKSCSRQCPGSFIDTPDQEVYSHEGSDVTLKWQFKFECAKVREFLFGIWERQGNVKNKIVCVREHNSIRIQSGYERKVDWTGNIYDCVDSCNATITMHNLTAADFKTYGVEVDPLTLKKMPLKNWLTILKFVPASITKWPQSVIRVEEGSTTTVECKATGRPSPTVIIQRENHSLCNSTGQCMYEIPAASKSKHEGEYYCLVQQRNSRQIKRSLNLTVIPAAGNRTKNKTTPDGAHTAVVRIALVIGITGVVILFALAIWLKILYRPVKSRRNEDQLEKEKVATEANHLEVESTPLQAPYRQQ